MSTKTDSIIFHSIIFFLMNLHQSNIVKLIVHNFLYKTLKLKLCKNKASSWAITVGLANCPKTEQI